MNTEVLLNAKAKPRKRRDVGKRLLETLTSIAMRGLFRRPATEPRTGRRAGRRVRIWVMSDMQPGDRFRMSDGSAYVVQRNAGGGNRVERTNKIHGSKKERQQWRALLRETKA